MYRAIIRTFDPVPKTDIELEMDIFFGFFESEKEAEKEANSIILSINFHFRRFSCPNNIIFIYKP